ncbi:MAG: hypothetical protein ACR2NH_01810 [Solirubrobacteraceae bacterium]
MTLSACGANFFDGEAIGLLGVEYALCARGIKRSESEIYGECVLDDLSVALAGATAILLTSATDQFLVERQADLARSHDLKATTARSGDRNRGRPACPARPERQDRFSRLGADGTSSEEMYAINPDGTGLTRFTDDLDQE